MNEVFFICIWFIHFEKLIAGQTIAAVKYNIFSESINFQNVTSPDRK